MKNLYIILLFALSLNAHAQTLKLAQPPKSISLQGWLNGKWNTVSKESYTIDASSRPIRYLRDFTDIDSVVKPDIQITYTYNAEGLESQSMYEWWDKTNNVWHTSSVYQNSYNANGKIEKTIIKNETGLIFLQTTYNYDSGGTLISVKNPNWFIGNGYQYNVVTYTNNSAGLPTSELYEDTINPMPKLLRTFKYNPSGKVSESVDFVFTTVYGWLKGGKKVNIYDASGNLFEEGYYFCPDTTCIKNEKFVYVYLPTGRIDYILHTEDIASGAPGSSRYLYEWFPSYPTTGIREREKPDDIIMPAIYFDLMGRQVEKQKNVLLIEQSGEKRRKVIFQE